MDRHREDDRLVRRQIGENIERRRAELGISRAECAGRAGVTASEIGILEAGDRQPLASTLKKVAGALGWEVSDLVAGVSWTMPGADEDGHFERER